MKTLLLLIASAFSLAAQAVAPVVPATVTVAITVDGKTYSVPLTDAAKKALAQFIADTTTVNADKTTTPKYEDEGDLLIKHVVSSLVVPLIQKYGTDPNVVAQQTAAAQAQAAVTTAAVTAASGTVTVQQ